MALLVRTWNLFHGNASPPRRQSYLREMIALACSGEPDVLCLQEVPVWAASRLGDWTGMQAFPAVARHGVRWAGLAGWATRLHNGLLRSAITGQANAILVRREHQAEDLGAEQISEHGHERRVCQAVRIGTTVVANIHLSSEGDRQPHELERALAFAESHARSDDAVVLAGDFNLREPVLHAYSAGAPGIDHILVRGSPAGSLLVWPEARRMQNGVVLSDHAAVELRVG